MKIDVIRDQDCHLYHTLTQDCRQLLAQSSYLPAHKTARKLTFAHFVNLLLYFYVAGLDTLRSLITNFNTKPMGKIGLLTVGLNTLHDAFWHYPATFISTALSSAPGKRGGLPTRRITRTRSRGVN